jgi:hypothetical protein
MEDRAEILRHRIEIYRRYLAMGVDVDVAELYLHFIAISEAELTEIERRSDTQ